MHEVSVSLQADIDADSQPLPAQELYVTVWRFWPVKKIQQKLMSSVAL